MYFYFYFYFYIGILNMFMNNGKITPEVRQSTKFYYLQPMCVTQGYSPNLGNTILHILLFANNPMPLAIFFFLVRVYGFSQSCFSSHTIILILTVFLYSVRLLLTQSFSILNIFRTVKEGNLHTTHTKRKKLSNFQP